jgi:hypothetical protein
MALNSDKKISGQSRVVIVQGTDVDWAEGAWRTFVGTLKVMTGVVVACFLVVALYLALLLYWYPKELPLPIDLPANIPKSFPKPLLAYVPYAVRPQDSVH